MNATNWESPKTTRIYLHPPLAERIVMLLPDFKIVNGQLNREGPHLNQKATGFILLSDKGEVLDCKKTKFDPVEGGIPIYQIKTQEQECSVSMRAFCDGERNPHVFSKITIENPNVFEVTAHFCLLPRTGPERYMTNLVNEGYAPYEPGAKTWFMLKKNWNKTEKCGVVSDGKAWLHVQADDGIRLQWTDLHGKGKKYEPDQYFSIAVTLSPGECRSIQVVQRFHCLEENVPSFDEALPAAQSMWQHFEDEVHVVPNTALTKIQGVYHHLIAQCLQMLARYQGEEGVTPRQGDTGRKIWPWEAIGFLIPLDRIGLFSYTTPAYQWILENMMVKEGEDAGRIMNSFQAWGNMSGSVLLGISEHLLFEKKKESFDAFRTSLLQIFSWIEKERAKSIAPAYQGIFPPGKGSDWNDIAQHWCHTDALNALAETRFAKLLEYYQDPASEQVQNAADDYMGRLREIAAELYRGHENDTAFLFPGILGKAFEDQECLPYTITGGYLLFAYGVLPYDHPAFQQMEAFYEEKGMLEHRLTGLMTNPNPNWPGIYGDVYYTIVSEMYWIRLWLMRGEKEKANATLQALLRYGLTSEYVASERYCSSDAWYSPWQPNASGSGRLLEVLLDFYGEKRKEEEK